MNTREWNSKEYDRLSDPQFGWGLKVLKRLAELPLQGNEHVMDAGCGTGRVTAEMAKLFPKGSIVAVDLSRNMLEQAQANLIPGFGARISFANVDLQQLPFNSAFDLVFSTAVFHWVKDHSQLFRSIATALRPDGWLVAQCGGKGNLDHVRSRVRGLQATPPFARFFQNWTEPWEYADDSTTTSRLRAAGFTGIKTWLEDATFSIDSADKYRKFIETVIVRANLKQIDDTKLQERFLDLLTEQAGEDGYTLDYVRLNIEARKSS